MITQERLKELLHYNPDTGIFTWVAPPCKKLHAGDIAGYNHHSRSKTYIQITVDYKRYLAHRLAWLYQQGIFPSDQIDHIDGCGTNNRLANLRCVNNLENSKNQRLMNRNTSGFTGVCFCRSSKKRQAYISDKCHRKHLGFFDSLLDAVAARMRANKKYGFHKNHGTDRPR